MHPTNSAIGPRLVNTFLLASSLLIIAGFLVIHALMFDVSDRSQPTWFPLGQTVFAQEIESSNIMWRYTKQGWQDIAPMIQSEPTPTSGLANVHPMVWAALLLFASLGLLVWSTEDNDIDRLFQSENV